MPEIQGLILNKKNPPISIFLRLVPKHIVDCQPEIDINQVTRLDIEADLALV